MEMATGKIPFYKLIQKIGYILPIHLNFQSTIHKSLLALFLLTIIVYIFMQS